MTPSSDGKIALLRHTVATLAYRGGKALHGAPAEFAGYGSRTPGQILAHVCDLFATVYCEISSIVIRLLRPHDRTRGKCPVPLQRYLSHCCLFLFLFHRSFRFFFVKGEFA